jgi:hypothetical protein
MPLYYIRHACDGQARQSSQAVELPDLTEASAYALSAAPLFRDLIPGERRQCAFEVRDPSEGWRLKMELALCLEASEPASDDVDGGLLE